MWTWYTDLTERARKKSHEIIKTLSDSYTSKRHYVDKTVRYKVHTAKKTSWENAYWPVNDNLLFGKYRDL